MICVGEGEGPLLDLCDALSSGKDHTRIANLWVKRPGGDVAKNPVRPPTDLDTLPLPDFTLFDNNRFYFPSRGRLIRMGSVETARGCPYRCSFCNSPAQVDLYKRSAAGSFFRLKGLDNVHRELCNLKDNFRWNTSTSPPTHFSPCPTPAP